MSINRMDKHIAVQSFQGTLLSNKEVQTTHTCKNMNDSPKYYVKRKKEIRTKEYRMYNFISMKFKNK